MASVERQKTDQIFELDVARLEQTQALQLQQRTADVIATFEKRFRQEEQNWQTRAEQQLQAAALAHEKQLQAELQAVKSKSKQIASKRLNAKEESSDAQRRMLRLAESRKLNKLRTAAWQFDALREMQRGALMTKISMGGTLLKGRAAASRWVALDPEGTHIGWCKPRRAGRTVSAKDFTTTVPVASLVEVRFGPVGRPSYNGGMAT